MRGTSPCNTQGPGVQNQNFVGGGWGNSERCLKWVVIKESFQKHFKIEVGEGKICGEGRGYRWCHHPWPPPPKILIVHQLQLAVQLA